MTVAGMPQWPLLRDGVSAARCTHEVVLEVVLRADGLGRAQLEHNGELWPRLDAGPGLRERIAAQLRDLCPDTNPAFMSDERYRELLEFSYGSMSRIDGG